MRVKIQLVSFSSVYTVLVSDYGAQLTERWRQAWIAFLELDRASWYSFNCLDLESFLALVFNSWIFFSNQQSELVNTWGQYVSMYGRNRLEIVLERFEFTEFSFCSARRPMHVTLQTPSSIGSMRPAASHSKVIMTI